MALSIIYSNFCGMVVSETRNGVESDYISDTLGSTIGLMDSAGAMTDRWEYWPYGEVVSRTGTNPTPLTFLGVIGYFQDVLAKLFYVRARHLRVDLARWLTADPLWPSQLAYTYATSAPSVLTDASGRQAGTGGFTGAPTPQCGHYSTSNYYKQDVNVFGVTVATTTGITIDICICGKAPKVASLVADVAALILGLLEAVVLSVIAGLLGIWLSACSLVETGPNFCLEIVVLFIQTFVPASNTVVTTPWCCNC